MTVNRENLMKLIAHLNMVEGGGGGGGGLIITFLK